MIHFTDGAVEGEDFERVSVGAVLLDPAGHPAQWFGAEVAPATLREWRLRGLKQVIGQAEVYPVLLARQLWRRWLKGRSAVVFVNNDSARFALIRGDSPSVASRDVLAALASEDAEWPMPEQAPI